MTEVWIAAVATVAGGVIAGKGAEKKAKWETKQQREMTKDSARYEALLSQFENEQNYYYTQLERQNKQRGLDQFRQFSSTTSFAPEYVGGGSRIVVPNMPTIPTFDSQAPSNGAAVAVNQGYLPGHGPAQPAMPAQPTGG